LYLRFQNFALPQWDEGARRLERDSTLSHRPITEGGDRLAAGKGDALAEEFWRAHIGRLLANIERFRLSWPKPGLPQRDLYAPRFIVLLMVIAGFIVAGPNWANRISASLHPGVSTGLPPPSMDAWISPPAYTGEAPIYLRHEPGG